MRKTNFNSNQLGIISKTFNNEIYSMDNDSYCFHTNVFTKKSVSGNVFQNGNFYMAILEIDNRKFHISFKSWETFCKRLQFCVNGNFHVCKSGFNCKDSEFLKLVFQEIS